MKTAKFLLCLTLCALMVLGLCYCNNDNTPAETTPDATTTTGADVTTPTPTVGLDFALMDYDDYVATLGEISASSETMKIEGDILETKKVGTEVMFHAKGVGKAKVTDGDKSVEVTVEKAKLNIVVIMGQSNSGNHFANATSDIACPKGTAYWWGNGLGTKAKEPVDFIQKT